MRQPGGGDKNSVLSIRLLLYCIKFVFNPYSTLRLVKRLYIPLPEGGARRRIIKNLLSKERNSLSETEVEEVVAQTEGYSGADMANLCKEAAMGPIRSLDLSAIDTMEASQVLPTLSTFILNSTIR